MALQNIRPKRHHCAGKKAPFSRLVHSRRAAAVVAGPARKVTLVKNLLGDPGNGPGVCLVVANRFVFWQASLPRRHLAVHVVVDVVPVHGVEGAAGDGEAVGGFVVDICFFEVGVVVSC